MLENEAESALNKGSQERSDRPVEQLPNPQAMDPALVEAVNQLVWFITDEFVEAAQEAMWLEEMLPEPKDKPKARIAGRS